MPTTQQIAQQAYDAFELATRTDGKTTYIRTKKDDTAEWITDLVREAHGDFLPDDWRYESIQSALGFIADGGDEDDPHEWADGNVDTYTGDRLHWLASNLNRPGYCNEAAAEIGCDNDIVQMIGLGQYQESLEIFASVVESLRSRADELETVES